MRQRNMRQALSEPLFAKWPCARTHESIIHSAGVEKKCNNVYRRHCFLTVNGQISERWLGERTQAHKQTCIQYLSVAFPHHHRKLCGHRAKLLKPFQLLEGSSICHIRYCCLKPNFRSSDNRSLEPFSPKISLIQKLHRLVIRRVALIRISDRRIWSQLVFSGAIAVFMMHR